MPFAPPLPMPAEPAPHSPIHALYADHHGWLQSWLRKKLGNTFDAADLAHDTFVRMLAGQHPPTIAQPRAYLTRIAQNLLANWCQRQALERAYLQALAAMPEALSPSPEQRLLILQTLHEVDAMLDALKPQARRAFLLSQIDGLKYEDIARELGVSLVTVKRYMQQGFRGCLALMTD
ncbi:RNA polymerase sigma-70 factor (ECF subfamily) [Pseudorhodoferax soli]|uniref:RNA polymerase sigma-70 factor (ECF subfamily) n=2 Tax=Pseudorhodoferax soli TaxID=545864 RepID=A0A368XY53_9BURK|nr:RNA polymerase sigma-70 factor (ECF subfamily) [Pseudorhodoferax soli]